ncbi:MAG TPA: hypothetical protein VMZ53_22450, partial [Kofleriaceae bacterium]|nr:hypothetical protein [Kofleriaceae bacterium]
VVTLNWSVAKYLRAVGGVALCMLAAGGVAAIVYPLLPAGHGVRALVTTVVVVVVSALLLAYTQGLTLRGVVRSMREPPP